MKLLSFNKTIMVILLIILNIVLYSFSDTLENPKEYQVAIDANSIQEKPQQTIAVKLKREIVKKDKNVSNKFKANKTKSKKIDVDAKMDSNDQYYISTSLDYRTNLGFDRYLKYLNKNGVRWFLFENSRQSLIAEIDIEHDKFYNVRKLRGFSHHSHIISNEETIMKCLKQGKDLYGDGSYSVLFVWPNAIENLVQEEIIRNLKSARIPISSISEVKGYYNLVNNKTSMHFSQAITNDGKVIKINFNIFI